MMLQDALFNWLQIKLVADARPEDRAAKETQEFFEQILREDHALTNFFIARTDETMVYVQYESEGKSKKQLFDRESAEKLLEDIRSNPKYN
jgi:hypothetical protein